MNTFKATTTNGFVHLKENSQKNQKPKKRLSQYLGHFDTCFSNNSSILRIPFQQMKNSQMFYQILYFPSENMFLKNIFKIKKIKISENNIISVKLAQVLQ
jgi:hypothetical protein